MQKSHRSPDKRFPSRSLRTYYEEAISKETISYADEQNLELLEAARQGDEDKVRGLISRNVNVTTTDAQGRNALYLASEAGHTSILKLLLEKGIDIHAKLGDGYTALFMAISAGHVAIVKLLFENGEATDAKSDSGDLPLSFAIGVGRTAVVELLLNYGADVNATGEGIWRGPPLHNAVARGNVDVVKLLLEKGANPNAVSRYNGNLTALHLAACHVEGRKSEEMINLLIQANADIEAQGTYGDTPLSLATGSTSDPRFGFIRAATESLLKGGAIISQKDWDQLPPDLQRRYRYHSPHFKPPPLKTPWSLHSMGLGNGICRDFETCRDSVWTKG
jgi:ankyrin repeat protein